VVPSTAIVHAGLQISLILCRESLYRCTGDEHKKCIDHHGAYLEYIDATDRRQVESMPRKTPSPKAA
jgi:hypothetical protein